MTMEPAADTQISSESNEQKLTDAGKYAFAGLAANILAELYEDVEERQTYLMWAAIDLRLCYS